MLKEHEHHSQRSASRRRPEANPTNQNSGPLVNQFGCEKSFRVQGCNPQFEARTISQHGPSFWVGGSGGGGGGGVRGSYPTEGNSVFAPLLKSKRRTNLRNILYLTVHPGRVQAFQKILENTIGSCTTLASGVSSVGLGLFFDRQKRADGCPELVHLVCPITNSCCA
jgi:hypothetical protein